MGPAANSFLRMLGVTAEDLVGQFEQLGEAFRKLGGTRENQFGNAAQRQQFAVALAWAATIPGMTKQIMLDLTSRDWERFIELQDRVRESIGLNKAAMDAYAKSGMLVKTAWRELGMEMEALRTKFALSFNTGMLPQLQKLSEIIQRNMPLITRILEAFAKALTLITAITVSTVDGLSRLAEGFAAVFDGLDKGIHYLEQFAPGLDIAKDALIGFGLALMASPIGRFITLVAYLLALLDDYSAYELGGKSALNWKWLDDLSGRADDLTGIHHTLEGIFAVLSAIALLRFGGLFPLLRALGLWRALPAVAGAVGAAGAAGAAGAGVAAGLMRSGFIAAMAIAIADAFWEKAKELGWDPGAKDHSPVGWGEQAGAWVREHILGLPPEHLSPEDWFKKHVLGEPVTEGGGGAGGAGELGGTPLAQVVSKGEGNYSSVNRGEAGGYRSGTEDLENKTVAEVMADQAAHRYNAAGRYQIIATTMQEAVKAMGLKGTEKFDRGMQDRIFSEYLAGQKRPEIRDYLSGKSNDLHAALVAASKEWASIADPDTGRSVYPGQRATTTAAEVTAALNATRAQIAAQHPPATTPAVPAAPTAPPAPGVPAVPPVPGVPPAASAGGVLEHLKQWSLDTFYHPAAAAGIDQATKPGVLLPADARSSAWSGNGGGGKSVTLNQQTTVQVAPGPDAAATAANVARAQGRVNENLVRNSAGVIR